MNRHWVATLGALAVAIPVAAYGGWFSKEELPPANAKPLSEVIKTLEDQGYKTIEEVAFENGQWEIEVHQGDKEVEFHIDPMTAKIVKRE